MQQKITSSKLRTKYELLKNSGKLIIFVEGKNDKAFYKKILKFTECHYISCEGKPNLKKILIDLARAQQKNYIGFLDSDFDNLLNRAKIDNTFRTDTHDIETEIIFRTDKFKELLISYVELNLYTRYEINLFKLIISASYIIGCIRYFSEKENKRISFEEINLTNFFTASLELNSEAIIQHFLFNESLKTDFNNFLTREKIQLEGFENDHLSEQICCGHDILSITVYILNVYLNKEKKFYLDSFEEVLRMQYTLEHFENTNMFNAIISWQNFKKINIIKDRTLEVI